ncbi:MAG: ribosome small subunit-dependent GTPase A [Anaerolineales bacterium]|nr:ribosome small subunit-dependent GTPase A [Anaerolineales bacterium]
MTADDTLPGLIVRSQSGFLLIETQAGRFVAKLRGRLKRSRLHSDLAAVGDRVRIRLVGDGTATIEAVEPRTRVLSRRDPGRKVEQVIVANPDQAVFVLACADPDPNPRTLDRLLVAAERGGIPAVICANKIDLVHKGDVREFFSEYERLGYPVFLTSAHTGAGVKQLRSALVGRISVLAGPSGVGKTSLLNLIEPGLGRKTLEISQATREGRHSTVVAELLPLSGGGHIADTPGLKAFALWDIEPEEVDAYFPEVRQRVADCAFSDCTHMHEPGCAVIRAVEEGKISPHRYDSYLRIRLGEER